MMIVMRILRVIVRVGLVRGWVVVWVSVCVGG